MPTARVEHCPTGIVGLDEVTSGGFPRGRTTLVAGGPGCGKTLLATEFLIRGIEMGEPGVFVAFEETAEEVTANAASLGWDLDALVDRGDLLIDHVHIDRDQIQQTGEYSLDGLLVRLGYAIERQGAKRVVLDTIEVLFAALDDTAVLRSELRRLFGWLKDRGVTAIVTAERHEGSLTRHGMEEYVSDCVVVLDHRVTDELAVRRMRIVKYRGSAHSSSELPFLIAPGGLSVVPLSRFDLSYPTSDRIVPTGVADLDAMLGRGGWFVGTTIMFSGTSGTGKTTFASHFAESACSQGERCLYVAHEEGERQILRNMGSVGIDLEPWVKADLLRFRTVRPTQAGLEDHLAALHREVEEFAPTVVVIDPVTDFHSIGSTREIRSMLMRMVDFLKQRTVTAVLTSLVPDGDREDVAISSLIDAWVQLRNERTERGRRRVLYVLKCRGMAHSQDVRDYEITPSGINLVAPAGAA